MKKMLLFASLLTIPTALFAQASNNSTLSFLMLWIVGLLIGIGIFLALRSLVLWYWKIQTIVKNQETQIYEQRQTNFLLQTQIEMMQKTLPKENI